MGPGAYLGPHATDNSWNLTVTGKPKNIVEPSEEQKKLPVSVAFNSNIERGVENNI